MRELTKNEIMIVSGAGPIADSLSVIGENIGGTIGKVVDATLGGIPAVGSISGVLGVFGLSLGNVSSAVGNIIGYTTGRTVEIGYSVLSSIFKSGESTNENII